MGKNGFYLHQVLLSKAKDGGVGLAKGFLRASMLKKTLRSLVLHPPRSCSRQCCNQNKSIPVLQDEHGKHELPRSHLQQVELGCTLALKPARWR